MEHYVYMHLLTDKDKKELEDYKRITNTHCYTLVFYCPKCGTDLIGHWEFTDHFFTHWGNSFYESPLNDLFDKQFKEYTPNKAPYKKNDVCDDAGNNLIDKDKIEKSHLIMTYQAELMNFLSVTHCPICGEKIKKDNRYGFGTGDVFCDPQSKKYSMGASFESSKSDFMVKSYALADFSKTSFCNEYDIFRDKEDDWEQISAGAEKGKPITCRGLKAEITDVWKDKSRLRIKFFDDNDIDSIIAHLRDVHERDHRIAGNAKLQKLIDKHSQALVDADFSAPVSTTENIKDYIGHLVTLEKNIFGLTEWLKTLYPQQFELEQAVVGAQGLAVLPITTELENMNNEYQSLLVQDPAAKITLKSFAYKNPAKPIEPQKPREPQLQKANLFNRRKVERENAAETSAYETAIANYEQKCVEYARALDAYNAKIKQLKKEQKEKYNCAVAQAQQEHSERCDSVKQKIDTLSAQLQKLRTSATSSPQAEQLKEIQQAVTIAETMLANHYEALHKLYSYNIVFGKYRSFAALSTIHEYLVSGRCAALEGPNGAYNLLENEMRMNLVIVQLAQVVQSLEDIKQNQYMLYSAIQTTNAELAKLNSSARNMAHSMQNMNASLSAIENNTAITAFNTEVTAYYSKKNAELTNALGFLVALK